MPLGVDVSSGPIVELYRPILHVTQGATEWDIRSLTQPGDTASWGGIPAHPFAGLLEDHEHRKPELLVYEKLACLAGASAPQPEAYSPVPKYCCELADKRGHSSIYPIRRWDG